MRIDLLELNLNESERMLARNLEDPAPSSRRSDHQTWNQRNGSEGIRFALLVWVDRW